MILRLLRLLRLLAALAAALALLIVLSYPDDLIPRNPELEAQSELSLYKLRSCLFLIPLALLLIICAGKGFTRRLPGTLTTVLIAGFLAWPVLKRLRPELVEPTFAYQPGMLPAGLLSTLITTVACTLLCALLHYFAPPPVEPENDINTVDAADLAPEKGRTVQQIAANPVIVRPRFLFGDPDMALVERFRCFVRELARRRGLRAAVIAALILLGLIWFVAFPQLSEQEAFERDLDLMSRTRLLPDGREVATRAAVHAGYRVMKRAEEQGILRNLTREQAIELLRVNRWPEAYRRQVLDDTPLVLASQRSQASNSTRFLTLTDGRRTAALYLYIGEDGQTINFVDAQDAGWDAVADEKSRNFFRPTVIHY
ncbi:MAG TPA: hypothetical protein H9862_06805 [Candidatus Akkermansia intestinigallinarum]|uniref:Uncharacterized protein n=1 Tax=Candidatus Akkermansia intestinigallinarum TaxID=2838431 RepID=A0A9D1VBV9_9BACT|nr:hypothetical protein [Candidatus Akkermansia intestinigallinarum]